MTCRVVHGRQLTDAFKVNTGVKQECLLSPFMFLLTMDWVMNTSTAQGQMISTRYVGSSWNTWTMPMNWPFFRTPDNRCRKSPALLQMPQHVCVLRSTRGKLKSWRSTPSQVLPLCCEERTGYRQIKNVWRSSDLGLNSKIRIIYTLVKPVLLYWGETCRITIATM